MKSDRELAMKSERIFTNAGDAKIFKGLCSSEATELRLALGQFDSIPPENQSRIIKELLQKAENEAHNTKLSRLEALAEGPSKITLGALALIYVFFVLGMLPVNSYKNTHDGISYAPIPPTIYKCSDLLSQFRLDSDPCDCSFYGNRSYFECQ